MVMRSIFLIVEKRISPIRGKKLINTDLCVRDFLLVYELLVESICFFFYHDEVSFYNSVGISLDIRFAAESTDEEW